MLSLQQDNQLSAMLTFLKRPALAYFSASLFVITWWSWAFNSNQKPIISHFTPQLVTSEPVLQISNISLPPISREKLHEALSGNIQLMIKLMAEWDIEAQILCSEGYHEVKRLHPEKFVLAQRIGRTVATPATHANDLYLPQSFLSASFLLALIPPEQIAAIPAGLRRQTQLYNKELTDAIAVDIDKYSSEKIFLAKPKLAFTAPYSHPATIEMLQRQQVELCCLGNLRDYHSLAECLKTIGGKVGCSEKAELMSLFMQSALHAIENRLTVIRQQPGMERKIAETLCLNHNLSFSATTPKMVIGSLLSQLGLNQALKASVDEQRWKIPLEHEQIAGWNPFCLIISTMEPSATIQNLILQDPGLAQLSAVQNNRVYIVNEEIQESPSQFIILACFDLYIALAHAIYS